VVLALLGLAAAATTPLPPAPAPVIAPAPAGVAGQPSTTADFSSVPVKTIFVTRLADAGPGSLREALERANVSKPRSITVIYFRRRGVIRLRHGLPVIRRTVLIDGTTAPGHVLGGPPVVEVNCAGQAGLRFGWGSNGSQLLGFAIDHAHGNGVSLTAGSITIAGDYLGLNLAGRPAGNRGNGLFAGPASSANLIGLNKAGATGVVSNVISANGRNGIVLAGSSGNTLVANRIGTNPAGTAARPNRGDGLAIIGGASHNEIGGTDFVDPATGQANNPTGNEETVTPVFVVPPLGNLISGNLRAGILIAGHANDNTLNGNFVGTSADGNHGLGNGGDGVVISHAAGNSLIGCKFVNNPFVYYNVISANRGDGLLIHDADATVVQGNFFGTGANNTAVIGNHGNGIAVTGWSANTQVGGVIPLGNVSAGNYRNGIAVTGRARGFTTFNTFGGLLAFKGAAPNHHDGLLITSTGGDNLVRTNVLSGNLGNGIELAGNAQGVTIDPDIAGLSTKGNSPLPNGGDGVLISGTAHDNVVGGSLPSVIPQDTFSGNRGYGLVIAGRAHRNHVFGAFIGTLILGAKPAGNGRGGVLIGGHAYANWIGAKDLISANHGNGVTLGRPTRRNRVTRNRIGRDRLGLPLPNSGRPVLNLGQRNVVRSNR
jgi:parallel beta-helix repeat protein